MKKIFYFVLSIAFAFSSCASDFTVSVENQSDFDRIENIAELPMDVVKAKVTLGANEAYVVINEAGEIVPSQITYDNKLIFQPGLKANASAKFTITTGEATISYAKRVDGKFRPERYDDFAWENDRIGFRYYGTSLMKIQAPTSGVDLWYKRTSDIILDKWYEGDISKTASYHVDHGEGCDPYAVGRTLGGGSMSPLVDSLLYLNNNYSGHEIYENGPLRLTFKLTFPDIKVGDQTLTETKTISLDAGAQMTKIVQEYSTTKPMTVAAGFPKRKEETQTLFSKATDYFVYEEPNNEANGQIYLGLIIPQGIDDVFVNNNTYNINTEETEKTLANTVATTIYQPNDPVVYYTGFGWTKFGFENLDTFHTYVKQYSEGLKQPFIIKY